MIIKKDEISSNDFLTLIKSHEKWLIKNNYNLNINKSDENRLNLCNKNINIEIDDLEDFNLSGSLFSNCDFSGHIILKKSNDFKKVLWKDSIFKECNFFNFALFGATRNAPIIMNNSEFNKCNLKFVRFVNCTLANVEFNNSKLFENIEFEDILTWDEESKGIFTLSGIENFKQVTFSDSYIRGLILENIVNATELSFEDVEIDEINRFKNINIKGIDFIDTKYLDSEEKPLFENCILDDVSFKDSTEFELFLEEEDGILLHRRDNSILTISIKCHIEQKSYTLNFLSNLKKSINSKYNNLVLDIIDASKNIKLIINSIDDTIEHDESLILLKELTEHISNYLTDIKNKFNNFNKSGLVAKKENSIQSAYELIGDCLFLDSFENKKLLLEFSSKLGSNNQNINVDLNKKMDQIIRTLKEKEMNGKITNINNNSLFALGGTINVEDNQKSKISIKTNSNHELSSSINVLNESENIDIEQKSKVTWFRRITIGRKRNFLFLGMLIFVMGLAFINYEKLIIGWNQISFTIVK